MNKFRNFFLLLFIAAFIGNAYPVPALRQSQTVSQPDGTTIEIMKIGDEHRHFTITTEGAVLHFDNDGYYRLAKLDESGKVISSGIRPDQATRGYRALYLTDLENNTGATRSGLDEDIPQSGIGLTSTLYPRVGNPKGLLLLVEYSDVKFMTPDAKDYFNELINGENFSMYHANGSALQYFKDQSKGQFIPSFDILGPVTLPQTRDYYGANNANGDDRYAYKMLTDAVEILDDEVDFSKYDVDGDGIIDNVHIIYAGQGEADYGGPETVWPHASDLRLMGIDKKVDGKILARYACSNEWVKDGPCGIGTFVHEFSHVLGLPDLYPTNGAISDYTPGRYSILDQGPYNNSGFTPPNYSAYELNALGWFYPMVAGEPESFTLEDISSGEFVMIPTEKTTEFFLIENRQTTGWDEYIPGHGMLVWHVDYDPDIFENNLVNNDRQHPRVDILEANNNSAYQNGYTFPGVSGKTSLTASTNPGLVTWDGTKIDIPVTGITEHDGLISFDVAGGGFKLTAPEPIVKEWSDKNGYFIVKWEEVEGADDYILSVYSNDGSILGTLSTGFDNQELDPGWNATAVSWNTTLYGYGEFAPSYKFNKDGQTLRSPETDSDITEIKFWIKCSSCEDSYLDIEGLSDGEWYPISTYFPGEDEFSETVIINENILPQTRQVRFKMKRKKGSIMIDDIVFNLGDKGEAVAGFDNYSTSKETSVKVDNVPPGYYYLTVASTEGRTIARSQTVYFELKGESDNASVDSLISPDNEDVEYYNLRGQRLPRPINNEVIIVKTSKGYHKEKHTR